MAAGQDTEEGARTARTLFEHEPAVRLVNWHEFSRAQSAVWLTVAVAVLSFITGMSHLSQGVTAIEGPLYPYLPGFVAELGQVSGLLFGFGLLTVAFGLTRRNKMAWRLALVMLPLSGMQVLITGQATDIPLVLLAAVAVPILIRNRDAFDRKVNLTAVQMTALSAAVAVQTYGTLGTYMLRDQFQGIESLTDAFYYIIVTAATVGYGDATPTTSQAKLFTLSVIVTGTAAFTVALGSLVIPVLEARIANAFGNMTPSELNLLEDHILVLGYGELTEPLIETFTDVDFVVVSDSERAADLGSEVDVLSANPTDEEVLREARIDAASGVVVDTDEDAKDALAILTARRLNPDVRIVAAASDQENVGNLESAGADTVLSPAVIGGRLLGHSVLGDSDFEELPRWVFEGLDESA